jgi:hypothetical protein
LPYAEVYLRGEGRAQVRDRLAPCSCVAVNVAVKCERKMSRKLGDAGVSIKFVYVAINTRLVFGADTSPQQGQRSCSSRPGDGGVGPDWAGAACGVVRVGGRGGGAVGGAVSWAFQRRLIYLPSTRAVASAATMLAGARAVQLTTSDGLRLGRGTSRRAARPVHSRFWLPDARAARRTWSSATSTRAGRTLCGWPTSAHVPTWAGFVYVAFVTDAFSRRSSAMMLCRGPNWIGVLPLGAASMTAGQFLPQVRSQVDR